MENKYKYIENIISLKFNILVFIIFIKIYYEFKKNLITLN